MLSIRSLVSCTHNFEARVNASSDSDAIQNIMKSCQTSIYKYLSVLELSAHKIKTEHHAQNIIFWCQASTVNVKIRKSKTLSWSR